MSEDLTKLESLSYRPAKSSPATLGFNSVVIRPEMKVNKVKDVGQESKRHKIECIANMTGDENTCDCGLKAIEQPNLKIIDEIECLISQVNEKIVSLSTGAPTTDERFNRERVKNKTLKDIDRFQKTTLYELRKAFE